MTHELRGTKFFVLDEENKEIGYIDFKLNGDDILVEHTIVTPKYRGQGYGKILVNEFLSVYPLSDYNFTSTCWYFSKVTDL